MFDADKAKRPLLRWEEDPTSEPDRIDEMVAELASACAEIERLRARPDWKNLRAEIERLRRLVGEACDIAALYSDQLQYDDDACAIRGFGDDRLTAIRHDAGPEGE